MDNTTTASAPDMRQLMELYKILLQTSMAREAQAMKMVQDYFQEMEAQQKIMQEELQGIREQLKNFQETKGKTRDTNLIKNAAESLEKGAKEVSEHTRQAKQAICQKAAGIIKAFKARGVTALDKVVEKLGLKEIFKGLQKRLDAKIDKLQRLINKLGVISHEVNETKTHAGNIGRAIAGKELKENPGKAKGILGLLIKHFTKVLETYKARSEKTHNMIVRIEKLEIDAFNIRHPMQEKKTADGLQPVKHPDSGGKEQPQNIPAEENASRKESVLYALEHHDRTGAEPDAGAPGKLLPGIPGPVREQADPAEKHEAETGPDITPIYLELPHQNGKKWQKTVDTIKKNGAKYDPDKKAFYITKQDNLNFFAGYIPKETYASLKPNILDKMNENKDKAAAVNENRKETKQLEDRGEAR